MQNSERINTAHEVLTLLKLAAELGFDLVPKHAAPSAAVALPALAAQPTAPTLPPSPRPEEAHIPDEARGPFIGWVQKLPAGTEIDQRKLGALVGFEHPMKTGQKRCVAVLALESGLVEAVWNVPGSRKRVNHDGVGYAVFRRTPLLEARN